MTELVDFVERERANSRIVADTLAGRRPCNSDALTFLRGGAVFWEQEHYLISWGIHLPSLDAEEVESNGLRRAIQDELGVARCKFGSIPVRALNGEHVVAITMFNGFYGDSLRDFFVSVEKFTETVRAQGWLLSDDFEELGGLLKFDDHTLEYIRSSKCDLTADYRA